ncbi:pyruvate dehydrogenase E2 component (dihydrolipoamide acetyltransferase) [Caldalkalibacillus uzonensis]|uniref:Dihydrolipoamide acetyltransferase component of pyruvate dehydrogenase complex n=1 Tax=Caldalkalibacillus uzonensis TaxID=353224 RepID=A0ABU0CRD3_9BACI|nr:dihydrolipoamide acetyltransferase family protein [Caldalkalibacillus uzonensis]MDQ0338979.1 pyruvate dehydrogenase E2 component (dihydrolipoamide acetyltransferase) [Caldalkalibacillus uzonensis]
MYEMKLADIGEGMTEGEIVQILVKVGETVEVDKPVLEVQTDKVTAELPAPVRGKVAEILVEEGQVVEVGSVILKIDDQDTSTEQGETSSTEPFIEAGHPSKAGKENKQGSQAYSYQTQVRKLRNVMAAPYTRKVARDHGVQIERVPGTGKDGRITVEDVLNYVRRESGGEMGTQDTAAMDTATAAVSSIEEQKVEQPVINQAGEPRRLPYRGRRKQIGQKMVQSMFTIPHVTHFDKLDMTQLLDLRERMQQTLTEQGNEQAPRLSIMAFVIKALAVSLREFPIFNAKLDEPKEEIILESDINIGVAVHTEEGLIVPVLKHADRLSIVEINTRMKELTRKAQHNQLTAQDIKDGTFTISNVGPIGGMLATPIINHPEVALIAFHQLEDMPVVRNKEIVIRSMMNFSMSFDHRVADGVTAVQFTNRMKQLIEDPVQLIAHLR